MWRDYTEEASIERKDCGTKGENKKRVKRAIIIKRKPVKTVGYYESHNFYEDKE